MNWFRGRPYTISDLRAESAILNRFGAFRRASALRREADELEDEFPGAAMVAPLHYPQKSLQALGLADLAARSQKEASR